MLRHFSKRRPVRAARSSARPRSANCRSTDEPTPISLLLSPGVAKSALENQADSSRDASFNVNGQRSELNNFMLDGVDNNSYGTSNQGFSNQVIQANPDSLAEFKIESNNYSAEFGRAAGAVISASIKSGTNQYHGEGMGVPP